MLRFALGYQQSDDWQFADLVEEYREHVAEVYFPWVGSSSGRAALGLQRGGVDWQAQSRLQDDLKRLRDLGVRLDILFNASCYGRRAVSCELENEVGSILEHLEGLVGGGDIVTTTSLAVARTVKKYFPNVEVRASVNMRIGDIEAMNHVSGLFDSFYLQRDVQRDIEYVREVKEWCDANEKSLCLLANSGCLRNCPGQSFHDNMVAHDREIDETRNIEGWTPYVCWSRYRDHENWPAFLQSTWIRPEDIDRYDGLCSVVKLATRMHSNPRMVLHAYANRCWNGNLLDLFEPSFSPAFAPHIIDNARFPHNWFDKTSTCDRRCRNCSYCRGVLEQTIIRAE